MKNITDLKTVRLRDDLNAVVILDQTRLPAEESYLELSSAEEIWDAIYKLKVRGAPAIGVAAAYGIYVCSRQIQAASFDEFYTEFHRIKEYLAGARPTAVNLVASLERMEKVVLDNVSATVSTLVELLHDEAITIREEDAAACRRIGEYALSLLRPGMGILTPVMQGIWLFLSMGRHWLRFIWGRREVTVSRFLQMKHVPYCRVPGLRLTSCTAPAWMLRLFVIIWLRLSCRKDGYRRLLSAVTG